VYSVFQSALITFISQVATTSEELEKLNLMFLAMDEERIGVLSSKDVRGGLEEVLGKLKTKDFNDIVTAINRDPQSDQINYSEFIAAASDKNKILSTENLRIAFDYFDSERTGAITLEQLRRVFEQTGTKKDEELWKQVMQEMDKDGNNKVSFDDFVEFMTSVIRRTKSPTLHKLHTTLTLSPLPSVPPFKIEDKAKSHFA